MKLKEILLENSKYDVYKEHVSYVANHIKTHCRPSKKHSIFAVHPDLYQEVIAVIDL